MGTGVPSCVPASSGADGGCALYCWEDVGGWHAANGSPLTKPTQLIRVLGGTCTTLPSLWFSHDPLSMPHGPATGQRCATLTGVWFVSGAEMNEGNGLRRVRGFCFSLFMA